jgi:hypothetical protein
MVMETPPNVLGVVDDFWFRNVTDFGLVGPDKGKGGKFLMLPPGYKEEIPEGYIVAHCPTFNNLLFWRGFIVDGSPKPARFFQIENQLNMVLDLRLAAALPLIK